MDHLKLLKMRCKYTKQHFIWDGKPAKIKKSTIIGEKKHGGLKMTDFNIMNTTLLGYHVCKPILMRPGK